MRQVRFTECDLTEAALNDCRLDGVAFEGCTLRSTEFSHTPLRGIDLRQSQLGDLRLTVDDLRGAIVAPSQALDLLPLLLVGDEQEEMVMRYLPHGSLFVCFDPDPCAVAVVTDEGDGCCELKNLAVEPCRQRQGYGRRMVAFVVRRYTARGYRTLRVGTGETPSTLSFYAQCGFRPAGRIPDFFTRNYDHPIVEEGVLLRDMILLEQPLGTE